MAATDNGDGSVTQTLSCPENTDQIRYGTPEPESITCSKNTGNYDNELGACHKQRPSQGTKIEQAWVPLPIEVSYTSINASSKNCLLFIVCITVYFIPDFKPVTYF